MGVFSRGARRWGVIGSRARAFQPDADEPLFSIPAATRAGSTGDGPRALVSWRVVARVPTSGDRTAERPSTGFMCVCVPQAFLVIGTFYREAALRECFSVFGGGPVVHHRRARALRQPCGRDGRGEGRLLRAEHARAGVPADPRDRGVAYRGENSGQQRSHCQRGRRRGCRRRRRRSAPAAPPPFLSFCFFPSRTARPSAREQPTSASSRKKKMAQFTSDHES